MHDSNVIFIRVRAFDYPFNVVKDPEYLACSGMTDVSLFFYSSLMIVQTNRVFNVPIGY